MQPIYPISISQLPLLVSSIPKSIANLGHASVIAQPPIPRMKENFLDKLYALIIFRGAFLLE